VYVGRRARCDAEQGVGRKGCRGNDVDTVEEEGGSQHTSRQASLNLLVVAPAQAVPLRLQVQDRWALLQRRGRCLWRCRSADSRAGSGDRCGEWPALGTRRGESTVPRLPRPLLAFIDGDLKRAVNVGGVGSFLGGLALCNQLKDHSFEALLEI
jgi:hypothetical protein